LICATPFRRQRDHTTRRVAVHRRARPANDLDLLRRTEIEAVDGALAVGQRLRDTVDDHLDAANAELRSGTEPANRYPQVLREVVAVLHEHARHLGKRFVDRELLTRELDVVLIDDAHRHGHAVECAVDQRGRDDDLVGRCLCCRFRLLRPGRERD
jgi:hypothetical protein